jgi:hypothetical protein
MQNVHLIVILSKFTTELSYNLTVRCAKKPNFIVLHVNLVFYQQKHIIV